MTNEKGPLAEVAPPKTTAGAGASDAGGDSPTGTRDEHYDLVSVLFHATEGAWNYDQYISDAERQGDDELARFFRDVREENAARGTRAKELLRGRLTS